MTPPRSTLHPVIFAAVNRGPRDQSTVAARATPSPTADATPILEEVSTRIDWQMGETEDAGVIEQCGRVVTGVDLQELEAVEGLFLLVHGVGGAIGGTSQEGARAVGGVDAGCRPRRIRTEPTRAARREAKRRHDALLEEHQRRQATNGQRAEDGRNDRGSKWPRGAAQAQPSSTDRWTKVGPPLRNVSFEKPEDVGDAAKRRPSSTARVAKYRANLCATKDGAERLRAKGRADNKKHYLKVKTLKADIAAHEKSLGITSKATTKAPKRHLPPVEELRRMSMEELSEWKRQRRVERRRQASRERNRTESIRALEARLSKLRDIRRHALSKPAAEKGVAEMPPCVTKS